MRQYSYWYEPWEDKISIVPNFYVVYEGKLYEKYEKCINVRGSHSLRWFTYILIDKKNKKFKRIYEKDLYWKYKVLNKNEAKELFPEEFI